MCLNLMSKKKQIDVTKYEDRQALCPHFGECGGCTYQKISYEKQLEMKAGEVKALIDDVYSDYEFEGILESPSETCYRNKMEFTFGDEFKDGPFALGLHKKKSFMDVVNLKDCKLIHSDLNIIRNFTGDFFCDFYEKGLIDFHHRKSHKGWLRHLLLRRAEKTGEILVALVTDSDISGRENATLDAETKKEALDEKKILEDYAEGLKNLKLDGEITGILHIVNDALSDIVKSDKTEILFGRDYIYDEVLGLKFKISAFSFFQTNTNGAEVLYEKAREYASNAHGLLFDLYSGTGTIAQLMSPSAEEVIGVEIVKEAVEAAKDNAKLNGIENARFVAEDVLKAVDSLGKPDSLILDPPREGINPKALGKILSWGVDQIVYVSCKPTSLQRDLRSFKVAEYKLEKVCCVDMFPQTVHVECVVLLSRTEGTTRADYGAPSSGA